jgi:hypothetical protein
VRLVGLLIRIVWILLLLLAIFGGVLDAATLLNLPIPRWVALASALGLLALDRELRVLTLAWQLRARRDLQARIDILARFRDEVINLLYAGTPDRNQFDTWKDNFHAWEASLTGYLEANFSYAIFEMFKDQGLIPEDRFEHLSKDRRIRKKHLSYLRRIAKHLQILERLIEQNSALSIEREPTLGQILSLAAART